MQDLKGYGPAERRTIRMPGVDGPGASREGIDRALNAHEVAKRIKFWEYTDPARHLRTVIMSTGIRLSGMTDRDAYWLVHGIASAMQAHEGPA